MQFQKAAIVVLAALTVACAGGRREKHLAKGDRALAHGRYAEASIEYRKALQRDPNFGEAHYGLGKAELQLDHIPESLAALSRAAALLPQNDEVLALLGELYLMRYQADRGASGAYRKVIEIATRLEERNPASFPAFRLKGYLAMADGKPSQALEFLAKANHIRPLVPDVAITLTQLLLLAGRTAEALDLGRSLMATHPAAGPIYDTLYDHYVQSGNPREAEQILRVKIKNNPADSFPLWQLAEHQWRHQERSEARETLGSLLGNPKAFPQPYLLMGDFYQWVGEPEEAMRAFASGAAASPAQKLIYEKRIIQSLALRGKRQEALDRIAPLLSAGDSELKATRAALLAASPRAAERGQGVRELEQLVRLSPDQTGWHFQLGRAYASAGQLLEARRQFETVVRQQPSHTQAWLALAEVASRSLDFDACRRYAEQALARDPSLRGASLLRARALVGSEQWSDARAAYQELIRQNPGYREARLQLALLDVVEGHYGAAEKAFRADYDPSHGDYRALEGLSALYFAQGSADRALALLDTEAAQRPDTLELAAIRAAAAARAGRWDMAIRDYQRLYEHRPDDPGIPLALGDAYWHAGDFLRAIPLLERAQNLHPADWRAPYLLGYAYQMTGKPREAEAAYRLSLRINPDHPEALNNLAWLLAADKRRLEEALALAQRAVRASGGSVQSMDTLGWVYLQQNRPESARPLFAALLQREPRNPVVQDHYHLTVARK